MRSFNLAESKLAERSFCKLQIIRHLRLILFVVIFVVLVAIGSYAEKSKLTKQVLSMQSKLEEIKRQRANSQLVVEATKTAQHLEEWHNQLTGQTSRCIDNLHAITQSAPTDVWLNRVTGNQDDVSITIEGKATSFETISNYSERLRTQGKFGDVRILSTQIGKIDTLTFVSFSLSANLKQSNNSTTEAQPANEVALR